MLKQSILASSALAAIVLAAPAAAQTAPADDCDAHPENCIVFADQRIAPDIIVSSGAPQYAENIGQAVTLIDRATLDQRQTVVLADLLATTPGVTVTRNGGIGGFSAVRIRGAEGEQTLTLIDGVRVNDPSSPGGGFDFANLLSGSIDRVEILRGPNSVPWGSQAIGGVVNVITLQPSNGLQARGNAEYGSFNSVFANAGVSGKTGIVSGALTAGYLRTEGISAAASGTEPDGYRQYGATGRVQVAISDAVSLELRGYYADSRVESDGFDFNPPFLPVDDGEYAKAREAYGYAALDVRLGRLRNRVAFTIADIDRDNFDPAAGSTPIFFARGRSERYEYLGDWRASDAVRLVGGAEREDTRFTDGMVKPTRGVTSVYGEAIVSPAERLTLTGGVRYDDDSAYGGHTTWGGNAVYALPTATTFRASYAQGFKAPTLYQLYGPFGLGNPNLRPEIARSYDVGIEQKLLADRVTAGVTWFQRDTRDQIDFDLGTFTYGNILRARAQGVEFALAVRPSDRLTLSASYSFIGSKNRGPADVNFGKDLARRPRQSASASVDWKTPIGLSVGSTVLMVGDSFDDAGNFNRLDGYVVAGVRAEMPIGNKFALYGRVDNLFDANYQVVRGYGTPGRAAYGGMRVRFD
ncbi:TonB-dependent receptor plug domain-containing protein [Sphingomonas sp.]|jgi:vitamin B12 transporter|uniref:TonB-dependent receptor plug domain-containing protein n=1 Tax=Sphingomonas sp. TaxID=28214 RepID=UPI002E2FBBE2|nr:TonB-dependent receptor [Sphingomonas sp.]HEX4694681.1 TonB-dependent receptor [Sphingomonas sp.]